MYTELRQNKWALKRQYKRYDAHILQFQGGDIHIVWVTLQPIHMPVLSITCAHMCCVKTCNGTMLMYTDTQLLTFPVKCTTCARSWNIEWRKGGHGTYTGDPNIIIFIERMYINLILYINTYMCIYNNTYIYVFVLCNTMLIGIAVYWRSTTAEKWNSRTERQWDSVTVRQCDSKTVRQCDSETVRQCNCETVW